MIDIQSFQVSVMGTNCYVITDRATGATAVVDPGAVSEKLTEILKSMGNENIKYILLTHGHFDHMGAAEEYARVFDAKIVISEADEPFLSDDSLNLGSMAASPVKPFGADIKLTDGDTVELGDTTLRFMLTPGHTQGSGCYISEEDKIIFSGDTLFCGSMGRTDFPTGDLWVMMKSLRRLRDLEGDYRVYPGHDCSTTLGYEREHNMYLLR